LTPKFSFKINQNARALKLLDRIGSETGLSESGKTALIQLINPFTDFEITPRGYFDTEDSGSVVQVIKQTTTLGAPLAYAGVWDCNIFTLPLMNQPVNGVQEALTGNGCILLSYDDVGYPLSTIGPVNIIAGPTGTSLNINSSYPPAGPNIVASSLAPDPRYLDGNSRLIGFGVEVHNTTAEIYRQGAVCVYRQPQTVFMDRTTHNVIYTDGLPESPIFNLTAYGGAYSARIINDAPASTSQAMLLAGSQQWEAHKGAMVVPTLSDIDLPAQQFTTVVPVVVAAGSPDLIVQQSGAPVTNHFNAKKSVVQNIGSSAIGIPNWAGGTAFASGPSNVKFNNFNTAGIYFSGLSNQTSLTINVIYYIERFPTPDQLDLVVMASPSPPLDPVAERLYSHAMSMVPVGVKVGDNADGDWFYQTISDLARTFGPALVAVPEVGPALAAGASALGAWAGNQVSNKGQAQNRKLEGERKARRKAKAVEATNRSTPPPLPPRTAAHGYQVQGSTWKKKRAKPKKKKQG
jgi:hypothetical protein